MPKMLSPSRLNDFLGCEHRTYLDLLVEQGKLARPADGQPADDRLKERGLAHEERVLQGYRDAGRRVVEISTNGSFAERSAATEAAMRDGADVVYQGCFQDDGWVGFPDFLIRVEEPHSLLGPFSYEVHDAKLARESRPGYVFQLLLYDRELTRVQGTAPRRMHLILGDGERQAYAPAEFAAYGERVRARYIERRAELEAGTGSPVGYPYKVGQCQFCPWWKRCADRRRDDDHVSLVANVHRSQGMKLEREGIGTVGALAQLPAEQRVPKLARETLLGMRLQAQLQLDSRGLPVPKHVLLEPEHGHGLHRLPRPSEGDLFFDFEGDPFWGDEGLEYLFGTVFLDDRGQWDFDVRWSTSRAEEKHAFESWIDWVVERLERHPDLHVFHYNAYEPTAIKRLAARHATREAEVDELLRRQVFVDLYGVVRQGLRIGVESYGLKGIEPVHGFERTAGRGSLRGWSEFLETGERALLDAIAAYNEEDCRSTQSLFGWLLDRRVDAEREYGIVLDELAPKPLDPPSDSAQRYLDQLDAVREPLVGSLPDNEQDDDELEHARRLMFSLLGYHRHEDKPLWWAYYSRIDMTDEQLRDEDSETIGDLSPVAGTAREEPTTASFAWTLSYPEQDQKLTPGSVYDEEGRGAEILEHDEVTRTVRVKRHKRHGEAPPTSLLPDDYYNCSTQESALFRIAERIVASGLDPAGRFDAAVDLLMRRAPRMASSAPELSAGPIDLEVLASQVRALDDSTLVIQGPPGAGKTYTGARLAVDLMQRGKTVGVVSTSHKAIINLLEAIDEAADEAKFDFVGWKKSSGAGSAYTSRRFASGAKPPSGDGVGPVRCVGATAWHWAHADNEACVDVLFVDEAGQVSLADALACAHGARNVVLLGDPQQLPHVSQGVHAHGSGAAVLNHLLGERAIVDRTAGVLLDMSWRMHPDVCEFVSETMYEGTLTSVARCSRQRVTSPGITGTGLRLLAVDHHDNRQRADEEITAIKAQVDLLLQGRFTPSKGPERNITLADVLIVAPYNAQVRALKAAMPDARVGTVDKFQGQEAPIVFFSMTSSSGDDVPRGLDFLFSKNRLNVAVSRAQALAVVVCSPALLHSRCNTVSDMQLINMLCRFGEMAERA